MLNEIIKNTIILMFTISAMFFSTQCFADVWKIKNQTNEPLKSNVILIGACLRADPEVKEVTLNKDGVFYINLEKKNDCSPKSKDDLNFAFTFSSLWAPQYNFGGIIDFNSDPRVIFVDASPYKVSWWRPYTIFLLKNKN